MWRHQEWAVGAIRDGWWTGCVTMLHTSASTGPMIAGSVIEPKPMRLRDARRLLQGWGRFNAGLFLQPVVPQ